MNTGAPQPNGSVPETISTPSPTPAATPETPAPSLVSQQAPAPTPEPFVPLTAEAITIPEGFTLDDATMTSFLEIMNNQEMTPAQRAQELVSLQAALSTKSSEMGSQAWNDQQTAWQDEVYKDPVLGGNNIDATIADIRSLVQRFGNDDVRSAFDTTGAGNNPHIVRFLHSIAAQLKEATLAPTGAPASTPARSLADRLYNNPTP